MAVKAYVLIQTEVGKSAQVSVQVAGLEGVVSALDVTGPYDVIVQVEAIAWTSWAGWWPPGCSSPRGSTAP